MNPEALFFNLASSPSLQSNSSSFKQETQRSEPHFGLWLLREALTKEGKKRSAKKWPTAKVSQMSLDGENPHGLTSKPQEGKVLPLDTLDALEGHTGSAA